MFTVALLYSFSTKLIPARADRLAEIVVDAVQSIGVGDEKADLALVEIMCMKERLVTETRLVRGLVLDHGSRHPDMPTSLKNCYILTLNVKIFYFKEVFPSGFTGV